MKRISALLSVVVLLALFHSTLQAAPRSVSNEGREYVLSTETLPLWSTGIFYEDQEREVFYKNQKNYNRSSILEAELIGGYVGFDFLSWLTAYLTVASCDASLAGGPEEDRTNAKWGYGMNINFLDQEILDPTLMENKIRLNGTWFYTYYDADEMDFDELYAAITLSIVNDIEGEKFFFPESIALFLGGVYSDLRGDLDEADDFGFSLGLDMFITKRVAANWEYITYGDDSYSMNLGLSLRF
jgi:hypothetical protein